ncbi:MAG: transcriptional repressor NrdR [Anaerolineae bacterium]|nr:transcriptional repressor NrdR [Anaerolineae bacterium]
MNCPFCGSSRTKVVDTRHDAQGNVRRRRECTDCDQRFSTVERAILTNPLVVKRDGRREEFEPEKLMSGLRIACARRPIPAAALDRIVERVEYAIRQTGRTEVPSQMIGDLAIEELRALDEVAYIRYAIVYMGLKDLESIRAEIDQLRAQRL